MNLFYDLPDDLQYYIWKTYYTENIIRQLNEPGGCEEIWELHCKDDYNISNRYINNFTIWTGYCFEWIGGGWGSTCYELDNDYGTKENPY